MEPRVTDDCVEQMETLLHPVHFLRVGGREREREGGMGRRE